MMGDNKTSVFLLQTSCLPTIMRKPIPWELWDKYYNFQDSDKMWHKNLSFSLDLNAFRPPNTSKYLENTKTNVIIHHNSHDFNEVKAINGKIMMTRYVKNLSSSLK